MLALINFPASAFVFEKYIDKPLLIGQLDKLEKHSVNTLVAISLIQTINIIEVLKALKKQNYYFD